MVSCQRNQDPATNTLSEMCERLFPQHAHSFQFQLLTDSVDIDRFTLESDNGKILIKGNHDKKDDLELFEEICDFKTVSLNGLYFALMHYPMLSWPKKNSGSIQLHGHIHAHEEYNLQNKADGIRRYDAGVDANNYYPVSVKQIIEFFENNEGKCKL